MAMLGIESLFLPLFRGIGLLLLFATFMAQPLHAGRIEAGSFVAHDTSGNPNPVQINFQNAFDTVPVVVALIGDAGTDAATIRITNVTTAGFDELIIESDSFGGTHGAETIHYLAVEPGRHVLPDGTVIEAGLESVTAIQHGSGVAGAESWAGISFSAPLPSVPSVITQLQTANSETRNVAIQTSQPFITSTLQNPSATGFQLALERSEVAAGPIPSAETVGWIAFPAGANGTFPEIGGSDITWSAVNTATNIRGFNNGCFTNGFGQISASAIVVAKKSTHRGGDGGWIRRCSLSATTIGLSVDEDTARDGERNHTTEAASIIAFSGPFHALLEPDISVTKASVDFVDDLGSHFALPNSIVEYLITVTNAGNSPPNYDTLVVTEQLPGDIALVVDDFAGAGSGPVQFAEGSPASGLICSFAGFASTTDCFDFSTDGVNFAYQPTDSGDGTDPAVTHIRASPVGYMAGNTGGGAPSFELRFKARIE